LASRLLGRLCRSRNTREQRQGPAKVVIPKERTTFAHTTGDKKAKGHMLSVRQPVEITKQTTHKKEVTAADGRKSKPSKAVCRSKLDPHHASMPNN